MPRVLFVCTHNSARSQMAQAYLRQMAGQRFQVDSAGLEPTQLNPLAVEVMAEEGLDISEQRPQSVFELYRQGNLYDYVITVCESERESLCPVFPGITKRLHLPFDDPAQLTGGHDERLAGARRIRDQIKQAVGRLAEELA
ncbi:Protein-tyrosine phosphatase, low molecular weight [Desulfarculus baarsii DSM 2075]|uniref:Protein-tyrosine phosphatase, low molecular weight n=1 Tax=Desulfarculus baarsii (strain ATCC 33931 / DSM 2075 / LMG 7858 / VKM B-1802 / 2st14) TaxID=644282 RepID=E1QKA6_DESB2|nr:arsenate reductase ArsC [Desulfarculus baarsii]ADK85999.1 Protein-tyrosine phosphatase, low molecular weight [Desulfarculus baarsii DSM 2075]